jgi:hypothetical protein
VLAAVCALTFYIEPNSFVGSCFPQLFCVADGLSFLAYHLPLCVRPSTAGKKSEEETEQNLATAGKDAKTLVNKAGDAIKNIGKDAQDQIDTTAQNAKKQ